MQCSGLLACTVMAMPAAAQRKEPCAVNMSDVLGLMQNLAMRLNLFCRSYAQGKYTSNPGIQHVRIATNNVQFGAA